MQKNQEAFGHGRLTAKTGKKILQNTSLPGLHKLGLDQKRDGLIYIPPVYTADKPAALAVMLHGAGVVMLSMECHLSGISQMKRISLCLRPFQDPVVGTL